jgi:hypothetical protein
MPRNASACFACVLVFLFLAILTVPVTGHADTTYLFTAAQRSGYPLPTFSLQYLDKDNDGKFSIDELVGGSFSGFTAYGHTYNTIVTVPPYLDAPLSPWNSPLTDGEGPLYTNWAFKDASEYQGEFNPQNWIESQIQVPLPATAVLLGAGLLPLAWARRKKRLG